MGMDLKPIRPHKDAPRNERGDVQWARYNWSSWSTLLRFLEEQGVDLSEFSGSNDGERISAATCKKVAKVIKDNATLYVLAFGGGDLADVSWALEDAELWRTCGGYRQY